MQPSTRHPYETHITVGPQGQGLLFAFAKQNHPPEMINVRPTCPQTFYGAHQVQPMLTYWYHGGNADAVNLALEIGDKMKRFGMTIERVKVEARLSSPNVPDYADDVHYFEFHFKVAISSNAEWNSLAELCALDGCHLSFNTYSKSGTMVPIVTSRQYNVTKQEALNRLGLLRDSITQAGFTILTGMDREYSIFDTNVSLDEGWLFTEVPTKVLKSVPFVIPTD